MSRLPFLLALVSLAAGLFASSSGSAPNAASLCSMHYAAIPTGIGVDDQGYHYVKVRSTGSIQYCPLNTSVQITVCVQRQAVDRSWLSLRCVTSQRFTIYSTKGGRGVSASVDARCRASGSFRTEVTGGDGRQPAEWRSHMTALTCGGET